MSDWMWPAATVVATLMGPILAVQAQKAVEHARETRQRKSWVFHQLMATRRARLSPEHVQALNMIDLAFYGQKVFGILRQTKAEAAVVGAWHEYLDHLADKEQVETPAWGTRSDELFTNILSAMAIDVGYEFDRVQLKKGAYSPVFHGKLDEEQNQLRKLAIEFLGGERSVKMHTSLEMDDNALKSQLALQSKLSDALDGKGALSVTVTDQGKM